MKTITDTTLQDALSMCIEQEQKSFEYYNNEAKKTVNLNQKAVWEQLAYDELKHKSLLVALMQSPQILNSTLHPQANSNPIELIPVSATPQNKKIIQTAINAEIEAYNYYCAIVPQSPSNEIQQLFILLSQEELSHKKLLENELENFKNE